MFTPSCLPTLIGSLFDTWQHQLGAVRGLERETIFQQTFIAPSSGTGSLAVDQAKKVLSLTGKLAERIRGHSTISK